MINIRRINFFEYLCFYSNAFHISLSFYSKKIVSCECGGIIFLLTDDDDPRGIAFAFKEKDVFTVCLISACNINDFDAEQLLLDRCILEASWLGAKAVEYYRHYAQNIFRCESFLEGKGFARQSCVIEYKLPFDKIYSEIWQPFCLIRGNKILRRLKGKGYYLKSFGEASPEDLKRLYDMIGTYFPGELDPRSCSEISEDHSSIVFNKNGPVAFCIISLKGKTITIEQLSSGFEHRNKGIFLLLLQYAVNKARAKDCDVKYMSFEVNQNNDIMFKILRKSFGFKEGYKIGYCVYRLALPQNIKMEEKNMGIQEFLTKYKEDRDFAASFKDYTNFNDLLKAVNEKGYSISEEDVLEFLGKEKVGDISDTDLAKIAGSDEGFVGFSTACSDACSASCSSKC